MDKIYTSNEILELGHSLANFRDLQQSHLRLLDKLESLEEEREKLRCLIAKHNNSGLCGHPFKY